MIHFIEGIFFILVVVPLLEGLSQIIQYEAEYIYTRIAVKTYNLKKEIQEEECGEDSYVIGFQAPEPEEEEFEEEDE